MGRPKVCLYIAASLDGFITRKDGAIDWLPTNGGPKDGDFGFAAFHRTVGAEVMGRKTYAQTLTFDPVPVPAVPTHVLTRRKNLTKSGEKVIFCRGDVGRLILSIKVKPGKRIWLVGGGDVVTQFLNKRLVDEVILTVIPVVLGKGTPLFKDIRGDIRLKLRAFRRFQSGLVQMTYAVH